MLQPVGTHVGRNIALGIAVATVAAVALLVPARSSSAQESWVRRATLKCEEAGGTLTTPGSGTIFECTFPPSINVQDILGTPILLHTLPHICFGPAHGGRFGPNVLDNDVVCFK